MNVLLLLFMLSLYRMQQIHIVTLNLANVAGLNGKVEYGAMDESEDRATLVARTVSNINPVPDLIAFQEDFHDEAAEELFNRLPSQLKEQYRDNRIGALFIGANSGLAVASRFSIINKQEMDYSIYGGDSTLSSKGLRGGKLVIPKELRDHGMPHYIWYFNTHLNAGGDNLWYKLLGIIRRWGVLIHSYSANQIRYLQLTEARDFIAKVTGDDNYPVFLGGDFNTPADATNEFFTIPFTDRSIARSDTIRAIFGDVDTYDGPSGMGTEWNNKPNKRIDYILWLRKGDSNITATSKILSQFTDKMTDHKGVELQITAYR